MADFGLFDLMLYVHCQQLRSCQEGQLLSHTVLGGKTPAVSLLVLGIHSYNSNWLLSLLESREGEFLDENVQGSGSLLTKGA